MMTPGDFNEYDVGAAIIVWTVITAAGVIACAVIAGRYLYRLFKGE